jgi:polyferredoxin
MAKLGMPGGLIRHTTQNALDGRRTRVLRPRIFVYAAILGALVAIFAVGVGTLRPTIVEVLRDRNALYRQTRVGIENGYTLKIANKDEQARRFTVQLASGKPALVLRPVAVIAVPGGEVASVPVIVVGPADAAGRHDVRFEIRATGEPEPIFVESSFFGPVAK